MMIVLTTIIILSTGGSFLVIIITLPFMILRGKFYHQYLPTSLGKTREEVAIPRVGIYTPKTQLTYVDCGHVAPVQTVTRCVEEKFIIADIENNENMPEERMKLYKAEIWFSPY